MKIVILKSSPNKNGASNTLADYFIQGAKETGHTICELDVARMKIAPCIGCYRGKQTGQCILNDDIKRVEQELVNADMIVYVTPIYFYGMCAQLKLVIDRLHCFYNNLRGKKSLLLATAWRNDDEVMRYLKDLYTALADYLDYQNLGTIMAKGCGSPELISQSVYAQEAYRLGKSI